MQLQQFENIDKTFQDYPTLIYDGPFSDHMTMTEPKGLTGNEMNPEEAKQRVVDFFGKDKVSAVEDIGRNDATTIKTYSYRVKFNNVPEEQTATVDVTQKGGHVLWMLYNRPIGAEENINIDQAKELGKKFLEEHGYKNMVDTYYLKVGTILSLAPLLHLIYCISRFTSSKSREMSSDTLIPVA